MHTWGEKPPEAAQPSASGLASDENDGTRELNVCSILFNGFHHERSTLNFHQCPSGEGHLQISVVQMLVTLEEPVADVAGSSSVHPADYCRSFCKGNQGRHQHSTCCSADDGHIWSLSLITGTIWHRFLMLHGGEVMVTTMMTMRMRNTNINWYLFQCMRVTVDEDDCWLRDPRGLACFSSTEYCRDICDNEMKLYEMTTMSIDRKIRKYANACIETMVRFQPAWQHRQLLMLKHFNSCMTKTVNLSNKFLSFLNVARRLETLDGVEEVCCPLGCHKLCRLCCLLPQHSFLCSDLKSCGFIDKKNRHIYRIGMAWNCSSTGRECHKYEPQRWSKYIEVSVRCHQMLIFPCFSGH